VTLLYNAVMGQYLKCSLISFAFKSIFVLLLCVLAGCYGTLGLESGVVADTQLSASSVWDWNVHTGQHRVWGPSGARLKRSGRPWAPSQSDRQQWLQVDFKREKRITGTPPHVHNPEIIIYQSTHTHPHL